MNSSLGPGGTQKPPTVTPPPPELSAPWWATLIAMFLTAAVTAYFMSPGQLPTGALPSEIPGAGFAVDTIMYMPHIVLLFGVLGDMFTYDGVWSIPSLVGVLSIGLNYLMQYFWKGLQEFWRSLNENRNPLPPPPPPGPTMRGGAVMPGSFYKKYDGCSVQGFEALKTEFAPQTLVITATVFCYYIFDIVRNRGWMNGLAAILGFASVFLLQVGVLKMSGGCGDGTWGGMTQAAMALFEGIVFGGSAYGIVQTYYPERLPSSTVSPFPRKSKKDLTMGPDGRMYDSSGNPYVILPNGQAVPDLSTAAARDAFAKIAGDNLGTGLPAKPAGCAA
jgi:hypothetical protein